LSKEKIAYDNKDVRIERKIVISKPVESSGIVSSIAPVVRKVLLKEANDKERDLDYWLSRPPIERLRAVTFIVSESLKEGERMDKTHIVKRKMKP
jgi:hypothetical protein